MGMGINIERERVETNSESAVFEDWLTVRIAFQSSSEKTVSLNASNEGP